ncbi:hypothetical protein N5M11_000740 [Vibrio alginolyticus]|nr:hypothetical protein [Vibrio alginolyticus]
MLLKKSKIDFMENLSDKLVSHLPDELNLSEGDVFEKHVLENSKSLVRTKTYLNHLSDRILEEYESSLDIDEAFEQVMQSADVASLVFQDLNLGNGRIVPVTDISINGGLSDVEQFNFDQKAKVLNADDLAVLSELSTDSNVYHNTLREMFKSKFDSLNDSLTLNDSFKELMLDYTLAKNSDVIELSIGDRFEHECTHFIALEDSVYKINGFDLTKIDIVEAIDSDLLSYETNDLKFDIISNVELKNKRLIEIECLLEDGDDTVFANINFDLRDGQFHFDPVFNKLNLSTDNMLELEEALIASINRVMEEPAATDTGSLFVLSGRHQDIQEIYTDLDNNVKVFAASEIHPMHFEKVLKAFGFETQKLDNQLAVKNKDDSEISFYQLNESNRTELSSSEVSKELKQKISDEWNVDVSNKSKEKRNRKRAFNL